jgi:asparagine synthase (glutamine-hydrolysing)
VASPYPAWLNPSFEKRMNLGERFKQIDSGPTPGNTVRPYATRVFSLPSWSIIFETYDAGTTALPLEVRHPLIDIRLVDYVLAIPPVPWCVKKGLFKKAMRGKLPESILRRPKAPLAGDPLIEILRGSDAHWLTRFDPSPELARYVNHDAIPSVAGEENSAKLWMNIRPFSLNYWLQHLTPVRTGKESEENNEKQSRYFQCV